MSEENKENKSEVKIPETIGKLINILNTVNEGIKDADAAIKSEDFKSMNPVQRSLLIASASSMNALSNILGLRINHEIGMIRRNNQTTQKPDAPTPEPTDEGTK